MDWAAMATESTVASAGVRVLVPRRGADPVRIHFEEEGGAAVS